MKNKKFKLKTLYFLAVFLILAGPTSAEEKEEEGRLFGTESLFEAKGEIIKNITPGWFNNRAPWTTPKAKFLGENFVVSGNNVYKRKVDGLKWQKATPDWEHSFTKKITAMQAYGGKLYLGTYSRAWAEVWESEDGITWKNITPVEKREIVHTGPDGNKIQIVGAPNFEILPTMWNSSYFEVSFLKEFNGYLYVGLASGTGAEIFRYSASGWEKISPKWSDQNVNIKAAAVFNDKLLIGTYNLGGAQLWKLSLNGIWSQINFGGTEGVRINDLEVFGNTLYIGLLNGKGKSEIVKTGTFDNFTLITPKKWREFSQFEIINLEAVGDALFAEIFVNRDKIETWELKNGIWYKFEEDQSSALEEAINEISETSETTESSSSEGLPEQTPLGILVSIEGVFQEIKDFVAALGLSVDEETQSLVAESNFVVLGDTTLSDVTITGDLSAGLIKVDSIENNIEVVGPSCYTEGTDEEDGSTGKVNTELCLAQTLYLQKNRSGNVDFFGGQIVLNPAGNVEIKGTIRAAKYEVATDVAGASAGKAMIVAGETSVEIETSTLTEDSIIMVTPEIPVAVGSKKSIIKENVFEVTLSNALDEDLAISWWVVN